jgi:hypothetical protein
MTVHMNAWTDFTDDRVTANVTVLMKLVIKYWDVYKKVSLYIYPAFPL